jgi:hypothetical protein
MRSERFLGLLFHSQHFCGLIDIFFAAIIASRPERRIDRGLRGDGVRLGKRDSVPEIQIPPNVKPMILAEHYPEITAVLPHTSSLQKVTWVGQGLRSVNNIKSSRPIPRKPLRGPQVNQSSDLR